MDRNNTLLPSVKSATLSVLRRCHHISPHKITFRNDLQSKAGLRGQAFCADTLNDDGDFIIYGQTIRKEWAVILCDPVEWAVILCDPVEWAVILCDPVEWAVILCDAVEWAVILCDPVDEGLHHAVTLLQSTARNIPEDFDLRKYLCENLKLPENSCPPRQANETRARA